MGIRGPIMRHTQDLSPHHINLMAEIIGLGTKAIGRPRLKGRAWKESLEGPFDAYKYPSFITAKSVEI